MKTEILTDRKIEIDLFMNKANLKLKKMEE
jgi:hypothetical protein